MPQKLFVPVVNINGTARQELRDQLMSAVIGIDKAITALECAMPHGRDYQGHPAGDKAYWCARKHAIDRIKTLARMKDELHVTFAAMEDGLPSCDRPAACPRCASETLEACTCD